MMKRFFLQTDTNSWNLEVSRKIFRVGIVKKRVWLLWSQEVME